MSNTIPSKTYYNVEPTDMSVNTGSTIPADERLLGIQQMAESGDYEGAYSEFYLLITDLKAEVTAASKSNTDAQQSLASSRSELILENAEKQLDQIKSVENSKGMEKFMKIFQPLMIALTVVVTVAVPSPLTVGLLVTSVGMFADQAIAESTGNESLFAKTSELITKGFELFLPEDAASIVASVVTTLSVVAVSVLATKGVGSFKSVQDLASGATQALKSKVSDLASKLGLEGFSRNQLLDNVMSSAMYLSEISETSITLAKSYFDLETAKVSNDIALDNAELDYMDDVLTNFQGELKGITSTGHRLDAAFNRLK